jgi:hypothetical protein
VQKRLLDSLNLVISDMANSCPKAINFFRNCTTYIFFVFFIYKRWKILQDNVLGLTLKPLSQTCWESRIKSIKAIKFQTPQIRDALLQLAKTSEDLKTKSEANCLATYEIASFEFLLSMTIW